MEQKTYQTILNSLTQISFYLKVSHQGAPRGASGL